MNILIVDTETTGFWSSKLDLNDPEQGNIIQLAFLMYDENRKCRQRFSSLLKPLKENIICNESAYKSHGINMNECYDYGCNQNLALNFFYDNIVKTDIIVGFNVDFDINMIIQQFKRIGMEDVKSILDSKRVFDIMKIVNPIVKSVSKKTGYKKNPTLQESYQYYFKEDMKNAHDAFYDIIYTTKIFFKLLDDGVIKI